MTTVQYRGREYSWEQVVAIAADQQQESHRLFTSLVNYYSHPEWPEALRRRPSQIRFNMLTCPVFGRIPVEKWHSNPALEPQQLTHLAAIAPVCDALAAEHRMELLYICHQDTIAIYFAGHDDDEDSLALYPKFKIHLDHLRAGKKWLLLPAGAEQIHAFIVGRLANQSHFRYLRLRTGIANILAAQGTPSLSNTDSYQQLQMIATMLALRPGSLAAEALATDFMQHSRQ